MEPAQCRNNMKQLFAAQVEESRLSALADISLESRMETLEALEAL
jgi:hypothetical protein